MHIGLKVKAALSRSDRFWAGLSSNSVVEQTFMRMVKTAGGPTGGRGITKIQCLVTFYAIHTAEVNSSMQCLAEVRCVTSDQHKESSK